MKEPIVGVTLEGLKDFLRGQAVPDFHARQILSWVYQRGAEDFAGMSDLPKGLRQRLEDRFTIGALSKVCVQESADGTKKFLLRLADGPSLETVAIPAHKRFTICVSSQAGCRFACRFCASARLGFKRNLTVAEIIDQLRLVKNDQACGAPTHVVFMGTGEPLDNYDTVLGAVRLINADYGFGIGARRITISTCGLVEGIRRLALEKLQVELSVSLHAADDALRSRIMPVNRIHPLKELIAACRRYARETNRQVTFEYMLARGLNADVQSARALSRLLSGFLCKVNLIPANPQQEYALMPVTSQEVRVFKDVLVKAGIPVTVRLARGQDIDAACGQLRLRYEKT